MRDHQDQLTTADKSTLSNVLWIGGSPCAGKSTVTDALATKYNLASYHLDDHYEAHLEKADAVSQPRLFSSRNIDWNELWSRPIPDLVTSECAFYEEEFAMITEDLSLIAQGNLVIAEGTGMMPHLVAPYLSDQDRAIWLVPSKDFQLKYYVKREWAKDDLKQCDDPEEAFSHWMGRDIEFAKIVAKEAADLGFLCIIVDGSQSIDEIYEIVENRFKSALPTKGSQNL